MTDPLSLTETKRLATAADTILLRATRTADLETPIGAFLRLDDGVTPAYLLESVEGGERLGRYSFLGIGPRRLLEVRTAIARTTTRPVGVTDYAPDLPGRRHGDPDPLAALRAFVPQRRVVPVGGHAALHRAAPSARSRYDAISTFEPSVPLPDRDPVGVPLAAFIETDLVLVFDHLTHQLSAIASLHTEAAGPRGPLPDRGAGHLRGPRAHRPPVGRRDRRELHPPADADGAATDLGQVETSPRPRPVHPRGRDGQGRDRGRRGDPGRARPPPVVRPPRLAGGAADRRHRPLPRPAPRQPVAVPVLHPHARASRSSAPARSSSSRSSATGCPPTRSPAPGRAAPPRPTTTAWPTSSARDPKERAEHVMLVDLGRNDLGRVARPGTVSTSQYMEVERYSHVLHLVSHVEARLRPELDALDALRSVFPAGTLTGAPKIRAMQLIAAAEGERRGLYGGAVGYLGYDGNLDTAITIRSAVLKDGLAHVHTGAGHRRAERARERVRGDRAQGRRAAPGDRARGRAGGPATAGPHGRPPNRPGGPPPDDPRHRQLRQLHVQPGPGAPGRRRGRPRDPQRRDHPRRTSRPWPTIPAEHLRGIVVSPGPGNPDSAGVSVDAIRVAAARRDPAAGRLPRHAVDGRRAGAPRSSAPRPSSTARPASIPTTGRASSPACRTDFPAARYHSLCVDPATLPEDLYVTATSPEDGVVMGLRHRTLPIEGVQFHPESVLTPDGPHLLANFLRLAGEGEASRLDAATGSFATRGHGGATEVADERDRASDGDAR